MQERGGAGGALGGDRYGDDTGRGSSGRESGSGKDSTMGKLMEKAGGMMKNENLQQKGAAKRDQAGRDDDY